MADKMIEALIKLEAAAEAVDAAFRKREAAARRECRNEIAGINRTLNGLSYRSRSVRWQLDANSRRREKDGH